MLSGECLLLVEGEERHLRAWDFVHCPPGTDHILVGPARSLLVFMTGAREGWPEKGIVYPRSEVASATTRAWRRRRRCRPRPMPRGRSGSSAAAELARPTLGLAAVRFAASWSRLGWRLPPAAVVRSQRRSHA